MTFIPIAEHFGDTIGCEKYISAEKELEMSLPRGLFAGYKSLAEPDNVH